MRHWSRLGTRNWRAKPGRTAGAILAIALGTGSVVWVTCCFESVRTTLLDWSRSYLGDSHINIEPVLGRMDTMPKRAARAVAEIKEVAHVTTRLIQRLYAKPLERSVLEQYPSKDRRPLRFTPKADLHGIELEHEFTFRTYPLSDGRMIRPDDEFACVIEEKFASKEHVGVGDVLLVWGDVRPEPFELEIVGLTQRRRIARFQKPLVLVRQKVLQQMTAEYGLVSTIDVMLHDGTSEGVKQAGPKIRRAVFNRTGRARIVSAAARMRQIESTHEKMDLILVLMSCVAMLTALFIILTTLSMGMVERIAQLGLLRCVGMTGPQLAWVVLVEVMPLGLAGILLGIPIGLALTALTTHLVPEYVGDFPVRWLELRLALADGFAPFLTAVWEMLRRTGIAVAATAGILTTLVGGLLPALAALTVSPIRASRPRAGRTRLLVHLVVVGLAAITLAVQYVSLGRVFRTPDFLKLAATTVVLLYAGYALLSPFIVWLIGRPAVYATAAVVGVRVKLLQDQVGNAVWRSAGICCGLMVGLSLIVGLVVFSESFRAGWQFPKQFPDAFLWNDEPMPPNAQSIALDTPGIKAATAAYPVAFVVDEKNILGRIMRSGTWYMGIEPDSFLDLVKVEFLEGDEQRARALLKKGGHILVADDFARARNKHLGDEVTVHSFAGNVHRFKVAGVIKSPALDIAAAYFQVTSAMNVAAQGSVIGSMRDLKRYFGIDSTLMVLFDFDLPDEPVPANWPPPAGSPEIDDLPEGVIDPAKPIEHQWLRFRQEQVLRSLRQRLKAPRANTGTAVELKDRIDRELNTMTKLLTAVPAVALLVAAVGVANLMTSNVASRARQLAILRAVGATRGLILRMVVGEALVLGLLGTGLGFALGLHLAINTSVMTRRMWGIELGGTELGLFGWTFNLPITIPWGYVSAAVLLTVSLCVLAGIFPARHASRTNVVDALHVP